eukprot:1161392-Pelagomonas_calceolata.AAC.3
MALGPLLKPCILIHVVLLLALAPHNSAMVARIASFKKAGATARAPAHLQVLHLPPAIAVQMLLRIHAVAVAAPLCFCVLTRAGLLTKVAAALLNVCVLTRALLAYKGRCCPFVHLHTDKGFAYLQGMQLPLCALHTHKGFANTPRLLLPLHA